jgi:SWI/SNF-related matrix-associated actin-dependent regulator of chromatin subfamily A3
MTDLFYRHVVPMTLAVHTYHRANRATRAGSIAQYDLVLTTYDTLAIEFSRGNSVLQRVSWFRIILDEGVSHGYLSQPA